MTVSMQRGDILVGRDLTGGIYTGITLEVWRDGVFLGTLENAMEHGWITDTFFNGVTFRVGTDHEGNVYTGASCSNNTTQGPNVYKWDSEGRWAGGEYDVNAIWSPWGEDVGHVQTGICPGGSFPSSIQDHITITVDRFGYVYTLRRSLVKANPIIGNVFVGTCLQVPNVYALSKYDITGNPIQKFTVAFDWLNNPGSGILTHDIESGDVSCDGKTCVIVRAHSTEEISGILRYDLTQENSLAEVLYDASGKLNFTGQSTAIHPATGEVICLHHGTGPIIKIQSDGTIEHIHINSVIGTDYSNNGALALDYWLDPRHCIVDNSGSVYMVDLTKPEDAGADWDAKSITHLFDTPDGITRVLGVYNPKDCIGAGAGVFGTVIGAT